jgi:Ca2+-binding RTX toxin-like protein
VGFVVLATPASAINTCATNCNCTVDCSTSCLWGQLNHATWEFEVYAESCGEYGVCSGQGTCFTSPPNCPAQACTYIINGTSGNDTINGGSGRECIYGYAGIDVIDGGAGDDMLYGGDGGDVIHGNSGNDCLYGQGGNDSLYGDSGYDFADGGAGSDGCSAEVTINCP